MNRRTYISKLNQTGKKLFLALMLMSAGFFSAFGQLMPVYVAGKITDEYTAMPYAYKQIFLESDTTFGSPLGHIEMNTYTNAHGIYNFTVNTDISELHLVIYVIDCNDDRHDTTLAINVSPLEPSYYTFDCTICKEIYGDCKPDFKA